MLEVFWGKVFQMEVSLKCHQTAKIKTITSLSQSQQQVLRFWLQPGKPVRGGASPPAKNPTNVHKYFPPCDNVNRKPCDISNIYQLDGNMSLAESESCIIAPPPPDKISGAAHLPVIASYNMRSLFPKIGNVKNDLIERGIRARILQWNMAEGWKYKL